MEKTNKDKIMPFVVNEHLAERAGRHFDLRIQYPYRPQLASWAVPKAFIPSKPKERVLALRTNDHSRLWLYFKGTIEAGYGKGEVKIYAKGHLIIHEWSETKILFTVKDSTAKEFKGSYSLFKFQAPGFKSKQGTWNLMKLSLDREGY